MSYPGVVKTYAIQAGRELRVIVGADKIDDKEIENLSNNIATRIPKRNDLSGSSENYRHSRNAFGELRQVVVLTRGWFGVLMKSAEPPHRITTLFLRPICNKLYLVPLKRETTPRASLNALLISRMQTLSTAVSPTDQPVLVAAHSVPPPSLAVRRAKRAFDMVGAMSCLLSFFPRCSLSLYCCSG